MRDLEARMSERIGPWKVREQLASSRDRRTVRAVGPDGSRVVLKIVRKGTEAERLLHREGDVLRMIRDRAVPHVVDASETPTHRILARPWVQGTDLATLVAHRRLDEAEVLEIARDLLEVVAHLHGLSPRVVHRGITPQHVIRRDQGGLWLVGFGALGDEAGSDAGAGPAIGITEAGHYPYAPEDGVVGGGAPADVYAVGMTVLHALGGRTPQGDGLDPRSPRYNASPATRAWIGALIAKEPARRPTAREALRMLSRGLAPAPAPPARPEPARAPPPAAWPAPGPAPAVMLARAPMPLTPDERMDATLAGLSIGMALGTWMLFVVLFVALLVAWITSGPASSPLAMLGP